MDEQQVRREIGDLEPIGRAFAHAQQGSSGKQRQHRAKRHQVHGVNPRQPVLEEAAIAEAAALKLGQIDVSEDEAGQGKEEVDAQIAVRDQAKAAEVEAQMVLEMVQQDPERRQKTK